MILRTILALALCSAATLAAAAPLFTPEDLHQIVKDSLAQGQSEKMTLEQQLTDVHERLSNRYPGKINQKPRWIFNQSATILGQLQVLYCSPSEYLIFFGSSVGTSGNTGRHGMNIWDFLISGEYRAAYEGQLDRVVYRAGDIAPHPKGSAKSINIPDSAYMLEYGHGNIARGLGQGVLAPAFFLNQDWQAMNHQLVDCGKLALRNFWKPAAQQ